MRKVLKKTTRASACTHCETTETWNLQLTLTSRDTDEETEEQIGEVTICLGDPMLCGQTGNFKKGRS